MPSNAVWVCYSCRRALKRAKTTASAVRCVTCGSECACIGYKIRVPRRDDVKAWALLQATQQSRNIAAAVERDREIRRVRESLQQEIRRLQREPVTPLRTKRINELKRQQWPK